MNMNIRQHLPPNFPMIVTLCGSTRFGEQFAAAQKKLTLAGYIVLNVGEYTRALTGQSPQEAFGDDAKARLDDLHKRKIDISDWVYVINVDGYIGESTRSEIEYAKIIGTPISYLIPERGMDA